MASKKHDLTAIIYDKRGRVLSIGKNSYVKTHPIMQRLAKHTDNPHRIFLHAEVSAILKCDRLEDAHKIVVFRFDKKGNPVNAKPCEICQSAIKATNIKIVEHT